MLNYLFAINEYFDDEYSKAINYLDSNIKLELRLDNIIISDYDKEAGYLD